MKYLVQLLLLLALSVTAYAQTDWHTYPQRAVSEIVQAESQLVSQNVDLFVSGNPFPSKTVVTYTGRHRPVGAYTRYFIDLWAETRNLPKANAGMLVEDYLFREKEKEYWMPVIRLLVPHLQKELKEGDEITIYYFYLGGFNGKKLREKTKVRNKDTDTSVVEDKVEWIFAVEEFQKISKEPSRTETLTQRLSDSIDGRILSAETPNDFLIDPPQTRSKSKVTFMGETRTVDDKKLRFLKLWVESRGLSANAIELLKEEALFREGDRDYWLPVRKKILDEMTRQLKKGDVIVINTILAGGLRRGDSQEWVFIVGEYSK